MSKDELLVDLCQHMLREFELIPGWRKLIAVGRVGAGHTGLFGYSFDLTGHWEAGSPDGLETLHALKKLNHAMAAESPTGRGWLKCMIRISRAGEVGADFEYDDPERWSHTPDNYKQRIQEYAAMPV